MNFYTVEDAGQEMNVKFVNSLYMDARRQN